MKKWLKDIITYLFWTLNITKPSRYSHNKLIVVTFHRVLKDSQRKEYPLPGLVVTQEEFDWILSELSQYFSCGTLEQAIKDHKSMPAHKPPLAITFDDGQLDNYELALPILEKHHIKATFYIPTDYIDTSKNLWHDVVGFSVKNFNQDQSTFIEIGQLMKEYLGDDFDFTDIKSTINSCKGLTSIKLSELTQSLSAIDQPPIPNWAGMMNWEQIKILSDKGHEIGSHTRTHPILTEIDNEGDLLNEINESKTIIEEQISKEVHSFCYPNGDQDKYIHDIVCKSGYKNAVITDIGINETLDNPMSIKRVDIDPFRIRDRKENLSKYSMHFRLSCINH
jgi:peptidoglycan/xylan/chitin deacetylase (PgdA/CDA1 family)